MASTETPIPDLSLMANIDRVELVAIVKSLGLDPDETEGISLTGNGIFIKERDGVRLIGVVDSWESLPVEVLEEHDEEVCSKGVTMCDECYAAGGS